MIFLKSFSLLFPGEAVNVGLIYSENKTCDYPVPHLANGFPLKAIPALLPTPYPFPAGLQGKLMWEAGGRCSDKSPSFNSAKGIFYVLPLLVSIEITDTQVHRDVPFSSHLGDANSLTDCMVCACGFRSELFHGHNQL